MWNKKIKYGNLKTSRISKKINKLKQLRIRIRNKQKNNSVDYLQRRKHDPRDK